MIKRKSTIRSLLMTLHVGVVGAASLCGSVAATPPEELELVEIERQTAAIEQLESQPAWQWLIAGHDVRKSNTFDGGIVHFVGYFRLEELDPELLEQFDHASISPRIMLTGEDIEAAGPVQVMRFDVPGDSGIKCAALVQVLLQKNNDGAREEASRIVASYSHHLPQFPLTPTCRQDSPPPVPAGFSGRLDVRYFGPLLYEPQRECADLAPTKIGSFAISADTRIENRRIAVGESSWFQSGRPDVWNYASSHFDFFMRGFRSYLYRSGLKEIETHPYGNYAPRPQDIIVAIRVIEDEQADTFCYVVEIEQGSASQRIVRTVPREGKVLPWNQLDRSQRIYDPGKSLIDWGTEIATGVLRESGR